MTLNGLTTPDRDRLAAAGARPCPVCGRLLMPVEHGTRTPHHRRTGRGAPRGATCPGSDLPPQETTP